jgi:hypothetical protein
MEHLNIRLPITMEVFRELQIENSCYVAGYQMKKD